MGKKQIGGKKSNPGFSKSKWSTSNDYIQTYYSSIQLKDKSIMLERWKETKENDQLQYWWICPFITAMNAPFWKPRLKTSSWIKCIDVVTKSHHLMALNQLINIWTKGWLLGDLRGNILVDPSASFLWEDPCNIFHQI